MPEELSEFLQPDNRRAQTRSPLPPDPRSTGGPRIPSEEEILAMASLGASASVVRLPPLVHGDGELA
jgi:hypothetical protein